MITPANYEYGMKELYYNNKVITDKERNKAIDLTISVLKEYGFDSGAEVFKKLISECKSDDLK